MRQLYKKFDPVGVAFRWLIFVLLFQSAVKAHGKPISPHDLLFSSLPTSWDEGIPLGNGMLGALIWQKDSNLRFSIDRADLWDLRPVEEFDLPQATFRWVTGQVAKNRYDTVQTLLDLPYERDPAPTKIPAGALEFKLESPCEVESVHLCLQEAICTVKWKNGTILKIFIDAGLSVGRFRFENLKTEPGIEFDEPAFSGLGEDQANSVSGKDLQRLNYPEGKIFRDPGSIYFKQKGYGDFSYEVSVMWKKAGEGILEGAWSITSRGTPYSDSISSWTRVTDAMNTPFADAFALHAVWWKSYWERSSIHLPDTILENQWYREMYKFGSASRKGAPPITLQAIWTADNSRLPPWKGDFHNDLNTQMSYWPGYSSNHMDESSVYTDWIWRNRKEAEQYTLKYFDASGLNYPGVSTLTGNPMGGWIQYACSPTVSAWLAGHFYLQWKYSMDSAFLINEAYPFLLKSALFIRDLSVKKGRYRQLPLSSSPEINDNSISAWFHETTNFDLALIRNLYLMAAEMAYYLGRDHDLHFFSEQLSEWPDLTVDRQMGLLVAPGYPLQESHRHFSHLMAIYPLGLIDIRKGKKNADVIESSLNMLGSLGPANWCGYSYSWLGNLHARAGSGDLAAEALRTFATCFCLPNSFHVNGDQSGTGKSKFTYKPFTLEGNFGFASGIQEMLLQSQNDVIRVFPAIPDAWKEVSFENLRAQGAFLVSATKRNGFISSVKVLSEKGEKLLLRNPFPKGRIKVEGASGVKFRKSDLLQIETIPGQTIRMTAIPKKK